MFNPKDERHHYLSFLSQPSHEVLNDVSYPLFRKQGVPYHRCMQGACEQQVQSGQSSPWRQTGGIRLHRVFRDLIFQRILIGHESMVQHQ